MSRLFDAMLESNTSYDYDLPVFEGYTEEAAGGVLACAEAHEDMTSVYEAMHSIAMIELAMEQDVNGVNEASLEIAMEGAVKNVFTRIIEMFKKLWAKLKNFFKSILMRVDAVFKGNAEFAEKYIPKLEALRDSGKGKNFKMEMYPYPNVDNKVAATGYKTAKSTILDKFTDKVSMSNADATNEEKYNAANNILNSLNNNKVEILDAVRGKLINSSRVGSEDFGTKCEEYFRGTKKISTYLEASSIEDVLKNSDSKNTIKDAFSSMETLFSEEVSRLEKLSSELDDKKDKADYNFKTKFLAKKYSIHAELIKASATIATKCFNVWKSCYNERCREYKKYVVKALTAK